MDDILSRCLAIAAGMCINSNAKIDMDSNSIWIGARADFGEVIIISTLETDSYSYPDRRRMKKHCSGNLCIFYHRYCDFSDEEYSCTISYSFKGDSYNKIMKAKGGNYVEVNRVLSEISIVNIASYSLFPLSEMLQDSSESIAPYCRPAIDPGCR